MPTIRFDDFALDTDTQELTRRGEVVASGGKATLLLTALLQSPGALVSRDDLRRRLWADEVFVDFEGNLNAAVRRLRALLDDDAMSPRLIETLPGRGYRFIGRVAEAQPPRETPHVRRSPLRAHRVWMSAIVLVLLSAIVAVAMRAERAPRVSIELEGSRSEDAPIARLLNEELGAEVGFMFASDVDVVPAANADFRLRGLVDTRDDKLRVSLRLFDAREERYVWSDVYSCRLSNIESIERKVAQELGAALSVTGRDDTPASAAVDPRVYRLYATGRERLREGDPAQAAASFRGALVLNHAHAPSLAGLAEVHLANARQLADPAPTIRQSQAHALEALSIDYTLASAHSALGWSRFHEGARDKAERDLRRAVRLNPSDQVARQRLAYVTGS